MQPSPHPLLEHSSFQKIPPDLSQSIPTPIPSSMQPDIYFLSVQFCLFRVIICMKSYYTWPFLCARLLSFNIMFLKFIILFLVCVIYYILAKRYCILWIYHNLFIHSLNDGHLDCFQFLVNMSNAAMKLHKSLSFTVGRYLWVKVLSYLFYMFNHLRTCRTVFQSGWTILFCYQQFMSSNSCISSPTVLSAFIKPFHFLLCSGISL